MGVPDAAARRDTARSLALALAVGIGAGITGTLLTLLLHLVQHTAFGYTENTFLIGVERAPGWRRVLAMSVGGLIAGVGWWQLRRRATAEEVSVTRALREPGGRLPILATTADAVLQIVAVGVGASLGREGAPRQVGATWAGWLTSRVKAGEDQRRILLACGAGAGLAAVYNVPIGGGLFTLEVLLGTAAISAVAPALISSVVAAVVAWPVLSSRPTYRMPHLALHLSLLVWAVPLGALTGVGAVAFVRLMAHARTHAVSGRAMVVSIPFAFGAVGAVAIAYPTLLGNGKGPAGLALGGTLGIGLAASLVVLKPLATAICLRSGAIGGLLTPSFATGAALGVLTGHLWGHLWAGGSGAEFALVGAGTLMAVTQRAPITALALTIEFTGDGLVLVPALLVAIAAALMVAGRLDRSLRPRVVVRLTREVSRRRSSPRST
jgi:H+/Cl- antiporter ClcA